MSVSTRSVFEQLGFDPVWDAIADQKPAYRYDFGTLVLEAAEAVSRWFRPIFFVSGVSNTGRTLTHIEFELPLVVDTFEQGVAWIAHGLGSTFRPAEPVEWLEQGRAWREHLPWVRSQMAYAARPCCNVQRDWFKLATKTLRELSEDARPSDIATLSFDGHVLRITAESGTVAMPANGTAWAETYAVSLDRFSDLPKRLMFQSIDVSVWEEKLLIARVGIPLIKQDRETSDA